MLGFTFQLPDQCREVCKGIILHRNIVTVLRIADKHLFDAGVGWWVSGGANEGGNRKCACVCGV